MNQILKIAELISTVMDREFGPLEKDALVSIRVDWEGQVEVHVTERYFEEQFSDYHWKQVDQPRHDNIRMSFETTSGNKVFCLKSCKFDTVRASL